MTWQEWVGLGILAPIGAAMALVAWVLAAGWIAEALAFRLEARRTKRRHL